ncbi:hypothetical protein [Saccharothrix xinjiangensis]|uniref:Uncharacterized protein n=1 Tax=Saccharothrix xinjiangensis TaxID=204798 RepID=A0ABV9Y3J9_9PSEU
MTRPPAHVPPALRVLAVLVALWSRVGSVLPLAFLVAALTTWRLRVREKRRKRRATCR